MNDKRAVLLSRTGRSSLLSSAALLALILALLMGLPVHAGAQTAAHFSYAEFTLGGGFIDPHGVAVDGSGNVFVADFDTVKEIPPGCVTSSCVQTLGGGFEQISSVAVDESDNVFVGDFGGVGLSAVKEIPPGCVTSGCVKTLVGGFGNPTGVAVDESGNVFVSDDFNIAVYRIPPGCTTFSCVKTLGGGFQNPFGVAVDGSGNVFVADYAIIQEGEVVAAGAVKEIPPGCSTSSCVKTLGVGIQQPYGVAVDGSGNLFVADSSVPDIESTVYEIPPGCTTYSCIHTTWSSYSLTPGTLAVDRNGNVFFTINQNNSVLKLEIASVDLGVVAIRRTSPTIPLTFTFDGGGTIGGPAVLTQGASGLDFANAGTGTCTTNGTTYTYSAGDTCTLDVTFTPRFAGLRNGAVLLTNSGGNTIATGYVHGIGSGPQVSFLPGSLSTSGIDFSFPAGVAVDGSGNVFVADFNNNAVKEILAAGGYTTVKTLAAANGNFFHPYGVAVDGSGNVFVADTWNSAVKEILAAGGYTTVNTLAGANGNFFYPHGVAVDGNGNVFVADTDYNAVKEILAAGG